MTQLELPLWGRDTPRAIADARKAAEREAWQARFGRAWWTAPYDTAGGMKKGDRVLGWRCPACGDVEVNDFLLGNNHGYHLDWPGHVPYLAGFGETCAKLELQRAHATYEQRKLAWAVKGTLLEGAL